MLYFQFVISALVVMTILKTSETGDPGYKAIKQAIKQ